MRSSPVRYNSPRSVAKECEETLDCSLKAASEANQIADSTAFKLYEQTETLESIDRHSDDIAHNLDTSQYLLNGMKSWWSSVTHLFTAPPDLPPTQPPPAQLQNQLLNRTSSSDVVTRRSGGSLDKKMTEGLDQLSVMLGDMHNRALEMNDQISQQNNMLDSIHSKVDDNNSRISKQKSDMNDLMKRW
eukprot:GHVS01014809.1.p1 GENE.GHVS01014809.1~~GHVS01014809.1.p1  ORF type:complete len:188 (+),score=33.71 GHVS01014809.1:191-754(+)